MDLIQTALTAEERRLAFLHSGRMRLLGLLVGLVLSFAYFGMVGQLRPLILATAGETGLLWSIAGAFVAFLSPVIIADYLVTKDRRLYCPRCGQFLATIRAMCHLNRCSECRYCGLSVPISQLSKRQIATEIALSFGGMLLLYAVMIAVRILSRFWLA